MYKALRKLMKNQAEFYKDFPISIVKLEVEYYLAVAPLYPSAFSRKIPKLINKITDQNLKKTFGKILKTVTSSGYLKLNYYCNFN